MEHSIVTRYTFIPELPTLMGEQLGGIDISVEKRAVLALAAIQDGIWDYDIQSKELLLSNSWKELVGDDTLQISTSLDTWLSRIDHEDRPGFEQALTEHIQGKSSQFYSEHRIRYTDGNVRWLLARGKIVPLPHGKPLRITGTLTDINDRKQRELNLVQQLDELRFALASEKVLMDELDRKNKELMELSITDGLTGLFNHRYLHERFDYEFKRARRYGGVLSCILIDIDHFKKLNDTYGHQYGDYVLHQIASLIKTRSREVDICGRYGGEEFMVISNVGEKNALLYASKLHAAVQQHTFEHPTAIIKVTVSIGVAEYKGEIRTKQELIERSDRALYQAKNDGRNLVRLWKATDDSDMTSANHEEVTEFKEKFKALSSQMHIAWMESTSALVKASEANNPRAHGHSANVAMYAVAIAKTMKLSKEQIEVVRVGALLHDIGKIGMPVSMQHRTKMLTERELRNYTTHPEVGAAIIKEIKFLEKEVPVIRYHHERFDGTGFPYGLRGREIPIEARIVAVANAYDNLMCGRIGDRKKTSASVCTILTKEKCRAYCPEVVEAFLSCHDSFTVSEAKKTAARRRS